MEGEIAPGVATPTVPVWPVSFSGNATLGNGVQDAGLVSDGRRYAMPWSYPWTWRMFQDAAVAAGLETFGTHTLRHSYRSWLDAVGTTIAVQQKLMRHADIRTTMNVYGTVVTDEMTVASGKVAGLALKGAQTERKAS